MNNQVYITAFSMIKPQMLQTYRVEPFCDKPLVISVIKSDSRCKVVIEWGISGWGPTPKSLVM
jgi:hypothetical protein